MLKILTPDFVFEDDRGSLVQLAHEGYTQINAVKSVKNAVRGRHYHKINKETFYIIEGRVKTRVTMGGKEEFYDFSAGDMFEILPGVLHETEFLTDCVMIVMYDKGVELPDGGKDIYVN
ncbi:MAG: cupin domain-containing protein [Oscillospiraceae bacterium]|nr:cupin domain-containing protein [Oscillospiraceae bacterium]